MPTVCQFNGIVITMYYNDHAPPHFHARFAGQVMEVAIDPVRVLAGQLPPKQQAQVLEWARRREQDILDNWARARAGQPLLPVLP